MQPLGYKPSALAIELKSSKAIAVRHQLDKLNSFPVIAYKRDPAFRDQRLGDHDQRKTRPRPHREMQNQAISAFQDQRKLRSNAREIHMNEHMKYT